MFDTDEYIASVASTAGVAESAVGARVTPGSTVVETSISVDGAVEAQNVSAAVRSGCAAGELVVLQSVGRCTNPTTEMILVGAAPPPPPLPLLPPPPPPQRSSIGEWNAALVIILVAAGFLLLVFGCLLLLSRRVEGHIKRKGAERHMQQVTLER